MQLPPAAKITAGELVLVCSRYDLGAIQSLRRIKGGSRESPKILVISDRGRFLIKRRAPASLGAAGDVPSRVALSHQVQLHLASHAFPVAPLVGTRADNNSMLELHGYIYEVFRFVNGRRYDRTVPAAYAAGRLLAVLHRCLRDLQPRWSPAEATYHAHAAVAPSINDLVSRERDPRTRDHLIQLRDSYLSAAAEATRLGVDRWPTQLIHSDWHPGNLLFAPSPTPGSGGDSIVAVLDFDAVRHGATVVDLANGALQFAVARRATQPTSGAPLPTGVHADDVRGHSGIRVRLQIELFCAFCAGYLDEPAVGRVPRADLAVLPWLMVEAMIVETIAPIAATGQFGKVTAAAAIDMTRQAVAWIYEQAPNLVSAIASR